MQSARVRIGSVGIATIEPDQQVPLRGAGGPANPRLLLGLRVTMDPRPMDERVVLLRLSCALYLNPPGPDDMTGNGLVGAEVVIAASGASHEFWLVSPPKQPNPHTVQVPISLGEAMVAQVERHRHEQGGTFKATARLKAEVAWLAQTFNSGKESSASPPQHPFSPDVGMFVNLMPFWTTGVDDLDINIPQSMWVERVLPGLGLDRLRIVEVALPKVGGSLPEEVVRYFDAALRSFDQNLFRQCMLECRDVRNAIERALGASQANPVGNIVEARLQLPPGSQQRELLNAAWQALYFDTNVAPHIPGGPHITYADARACLHLTAVVIEYLGQLLS